MKPRKALGVHWLDSLLYPLGIALLTLAIFAIGFGPSGQRDAFIIVSAIPLGLFLGVAGIRAPIPARVTDALRVRIWTHYLAAALTAGGLGLLIYWCGMRQFGAADCSISIDVGWRLINGQKPYIDFPCPMPVGFYLGSELAFRLFGVFWRAQVLITVLYAIVTFLWLWKLLDGILDDWALAIFIAFCCESASMLVVSFWWYNPITSIAAAVCVTSCIALLRFPNSLIYLVSFSLSLVLVALMKPNVGAIVILGCAGFLLFLPRLGARTLAASISALVLWLLILSLHGSGIQQVLGSYLSVANRGLSPEQFCFMQDLAPLEKVLSWLAFVASCAPWIVVFRNPSRLALARSQIAFVALAAGTYGFASNNDLKVVDILLQLLSGIFLVAQPSQQSRKLTIPRPWKPYLLVLLSALTSVSIAQAVTRHRVQIMGYGLFFEDQLRDKPLSNGFFSGLDAGDNLESVIERISQMRSLPGRNPIFFGPRLQWAYAAFGIASPVNQPVFWQPGAFFPSADEPLYTQRWLDAGFNTAVFLDFLYYSPEFLTTLASVYQIDPQFPNIYMARDPYGTEMRMAFQILRRRPLPVASPR